MIKLDPDKTALVLIDLQHGIVSMSLQPRSGETVVATGKQLAKKFRAAKSTVILVHVGFAADFKDAPPQNVDQSMASVKDRAADWSDFVPGLQQPGDLTILKHQWGAFYGTDLDLQLRRRGITTIVLGGIATNFGVESTARSAWEHGYDVVAVEDVMAGPAADLHDMAIKSIFPRIARVIKSADIQL